MTKETAKKIFIPYFPKGLKYITPVLFGAGIYVAIVGHPIWCAILVVLATIILTTNYVTKIDLENKVYHDYLSMVFISLDKESKRFNALDRIVITKGDYAQTVNTRVQSRQFDWTDYTGILVFDDGETLDLLTKNSKRELIVGLKELSDFLKVGVEDQSTSKHYWVYMEGI